MVRKICISTALFLFVGMVVPTKAENEDWSVSFDSTFSGKYVWRGITIVDDPVYQAAVTVAYKKFSFSLWGNMELTDINDYGEGFGSGIREFTELDYTLDYSNSIGNLNLSAGMIHYQFPNTPFESTTELYAGLGFDSLLSPSITVYRDVDQANGMYAVVSASHSIQLWAEYFTLDASGWLALGSSAHNQFYYGSEDLGAADAGLSISMPITLNGSWTVIPSLHFSTLLESSIRETVGQPDNVWIGLGLSYSY